MGSCALLLLSLLIPAVIKVDAAVTSDRFGQEEKAFSYFSSESNASEVTGVLEDTAEFMRVLYMEEPQQLYVLVGAKNILYNISTVTMEVEASYPWVPHAEHVASCDDDKVKYLYDCNSYIRSIRRLKDNKLSVCVSSAKVPACRLLAPKASEFGDWVDNDTSLAYAPAFPWDDIVVYNTEENIVYSASNFLLGTSRYNVLFRDGFIAADGSKVEPMVSAYNTDAITADPSVGMFPQFKKIFETAHFVYLMFTEPAKETYSTQKTIYSRVGRVCKSDLGSPYRGNSLELVTFFKTRLLCGLPEQLASSDATTGRYSYYFNQLVSVTDVYTESVHGERLLVAAFNSPRNGLTGSAICKYRLSDIERVFDNSPISHHSSAAAADLDRTKRPALCPANTRNLTREDLKYVQMPLLRDAVRALANDTIYIQTGVDYQITQVVIDGQVKGPDNRNRSVIFASTDNGKLLKLVKYKKPANDVARFHLVEEREVFPGESIRQMKLITVSNHRYLLLSTYETIKRVAVQKCHKYSDSCDRCIGLRDPYCSWSVSHEACVSASHSAKDRFQSVDTGHHVVCSTYSTTTTEETHTAVTVDVDGSGGKEDGTQLIYRTAGSSQQQAAADNLRNALIAVTVVCSAVFFTAGILVGYFKFRVRSPTQHLESEISRGKERKEVFRSDSDAYQTVPRLPTHKLDYKNNLSPARPAITQQQLGEAKQTTEATVSKKVYV